jgi:hypothetical protein
MLRNWLKIAFINYKKELAFHIYQSFRIDFGIDRIYADSASLE